VYKRCRDSIYPASAGPRPGAVPRLIATMRASIPAAILVGVLAHGMSACSDARSLGPTVGSLGKDRASSNGETMTSKVATHLIRLQAGDKIKLTVFGEDKISGEYELDPSGYLSLPLAGTIPAAGLSKIDLEQTITTKLRSSYLRDPKVTIDVISYRPIYVLGEVQKPGEYAYRSGLNVMSALAVAGGVTYRASNSRVMIQRFGERSLKEHALDAGVPIMPGDVIRLPERYF
jgi:protein involved in polysaccharide export with SLBB domain